jgi:hypothetical protein
MTGATVDRAVIEDLIRRKLEHPPNLLIQPLTDAGNAQRFHAMFGEELSWVEKWNSWLVWDGKPLGRPHSLSRVKPFGWRVRQLQTGYEGNGGDRWLALRT